MSYLEFTYGKSARLADSSYLYSWVGVNWLGLWCVSFSSMIVAADLNGRRVCVSTIGNFLMLMWSKVFFFLCRYSMLLAFIGL
jgi:hypothetical protein